MHGEEIITPVESTAPIRSGDRLLFAGMVSAIAELQSIKGLELVTNNGQILPALKNKKAKIVEAVVSQHSSLLHKKIKETHFRNKYDAAVIAVHQNNERIKSKIGDIVLKPGDMLLMFTGHDFPKKDYPHDFFVINTINGHAILPSMSSFKSWMSVAIFFMLVLLVSFNLFSLLSASALAVVLFFLFKIITPDEAGEYVQLNVLLLIASSFGIGTALIHSGAAEWIANGILSLTKPIGGNFLVLAAIYFATNLLTEIITNNAAAVMMFPIAMEVAAKASLNPTALALIIAVSASASFSTPIGYQTNMIVYGPGGYTFKDFLKIGIPLNLIVMMITLMIVYMVWIA